jgi:8-oxo-dGTP pyrophosphatase MutT (NUDIX family)
MTRDMRRSEAAVALIRDQGADGRSRWLARWNPKWEAFHFVAGHRRPEESFRACLVREIGEELGLREREDYSVSTAPPLHVDFTAWSVSARAETRYAMELFDVELTPAAQSRIAADPENRWLAEAEVRAGRSEDGRPISATMVRLLDESRHRQETGVP